MNGIALFETGEVPKFDIFHPSRRMLSNSKPEVTNDIALAKQELVQFNRWLTDG